MTDKRYIECGKIINTHGCRGGVKAESWCNSEEDLAELSRVFILHGSEYEEYKVTKSSIFKQFVLLDLKGVDDMDKAMLLKNKTLYALREDFALEEGEFFLADMIGLDVIDADNGRVYGTLTDVTDGVRHQIYTIKTDKGEVLFPAVKEFLKEIDTERGVFIHVIPGFFDDEI
jgi:16S rRNA processing protein RimM